MRFPGVTSKQTQNMKFNLEFQLFLRFLLQVISKKLHTSNSIKRGTSPVFKIYIYSICFIRQIIIMKVKASMSVGDSI